MNIKIIELDVPTHFCCPIDAMVVDHSKKVVGQACQLLDKTCCILSHFCSQDEVGYCWFVNLIVDLMLSMVWLLARLWLYCGWRSNGL